MTVVYLDSVFLFNALLDYLLFLSTARLAGIPLRRRRYLLCGVLGGLYAAAVFLPGGGFLTETLVKAGVGLLLALIAFGREDPFSPADAAGRRHRLRLGGDGSGPRTVGGAAHSQRPGNFLYECQRENPAAFCVRGLPAADGDLSAAAAHGIRGECLAVTVCLLGQTVALTALLDTATACGTPPGNRC